jgi:hypothetical protein
MKYTLLAMGQAIHPRLEINLECGCDSLCVLEAERISKILFKAGYYNFALFRDSDGPILDEWTIPLHEPTLVRRKAGTR